MSQKLGGPQPKTGGKLRPILILDLGDRSHSRRQCHVTIDVIRTSGCPSAMSTAYTFMLGLVGRIFGSWGLRGGRVSFKQVKKIRTLPVVYILRHCKHDCATL